MQHTSLLFKNHWKMAFLVVDDTVLYSISGSIFSAINFLSYLHHLYFVVLLEVTANIGKIAVKKKQFLKFRCHDWVRSGFLISKMDSTYSKPSSCLNWCWYSYEQCWNKKYQIICINCLFQGNVILHRCCHIEKWIYCKCVKLGAVIGGVPCQF